MLARAIYSMIFILVSVFFSYAADEITYEDPDGPVVSFNSDGTVRSIKATAEVPLVTQSRDEINDAKKEARTLAKAEISSFLNNKIASSSAQEAMVTTIMHADGSASRDKIKKQLTKVNESTESFLKGVVVLMEDVNIPQKYVRVQMGFNEATVRAANSLQQKQNSNQTEPNSGASTSGREVRKSKMYDNF